MLNGTDTAGERERAIFLYITESQEEGIEEREDNKQGEGHICGVYQVKEDGCACVCVQTGRERESMCQLAGYSLIQFVVWPLISLPFLYIQPKGPTNESEAWRETRSLRKRGEKVT